MDREIVVNGRFLSRRITGVERYGREILSILRNACRVEETRFNGITGHVWEQFILPVKLNRNSTLWSPANTGPLFVRNQALTIHDLSPLEHPEWFKKGFAGWYRIFLPILAKQVSTIFTPSNYVKQIIMKRLGVGNVIVTPNGVDLSIFHPFQNHKPSDLPDKYVLFVGSIQPRKNLAALIQAWQEVKWYYRDTWLVIAGSAGDIFRNTKLPVDDRVRFFGYVPEKFLPALYANAQLFILPSFDEGFGLPIIEAMACGTPVLASNGGALPETVGDAGVIFDLTNPGDLAESMKNILGSENLRSTMREKGLKRVHKFSWHATSDLLLAKLKHPQHLSLSTEAL